MLVECLISVSIMMVTLCFLVGFLNDCSADLYDLIFELEERTEFNQLRMLFENDLFIRRQSKINTATNGKDRFCIGFWEHTEGDLKYLIYDFHSQNNSTEIGRFTRSCFNQDDLTGSVSGEYCRMMISNISNGIYSTQNQVKYQKDYSEHCKGHLSIDGNFIRINLGDYRYVFN